MVENRPFKLGILVALAPVICAEVRPASAIEVSQQLSTSPARAHGSPLLPLRRLDPPRDVPADSFNSAFCSRWDDGCQQCERERMAEPIRCEPIGRAQPDLECQRKPVACTQDGGELPGRSQCLRVLTLRVRRDNSGTMTGYELQTCNSGLCEPELRPRFVSANAPNLRTVLKRYSEQLAIRLEDFERHSIFCVSAKRDYCRNRRTADPSLCGRR